MSWLIKTRAWLWYHDMHAYGLMEKPHRSYGHSPIKIRAWSWKPHMAWDLIVKSKWILQPLVDSHEPCVHVSRYIYKILKLQMIINGKWKYKKSFWEWIIVGFWDWYWPICLGLWIVFLTWHDTCLGSSSHGSLTYHDR